MQKLALLTSLCLFGTAIAAQSTQKVREVGVQLDGINFDGITSFAAFYKNQLHDNVYRRIRFLSGGFGFQTQGDDNIDINFKAALAIGREKRSQLDRKLQFYRGFEVIGSSSIFAKTGVEQTNISLGVALGLVFGLQHNFNEFWSINAETIPSIGADVGITNDNGFGGISANFSNTVAIGVVRRF